MVKSEEPRADKTVLVIGGGKWQCPLIEKAKDMKYTVIAADINPAAPGRNISDRFVTIDTNDRDGLLKIAKENKVSFVLTDQTDRTVPVMAYINAKLGLNGITPEIAERFTDKFVMRTALVNAGVPLPRFKEISTREDALETFESWQMPVIIKPKASQSSFGVFKIDRPEQIDACWTETVKFSSDGKILIEEFVDGTEITVESIVVNKKCDILAISEKCHFPFNPCVAFKLSYPPRFSQDLIGKIGTVHKKIVSILELVDGISHAEYRIRNETPFLVEIAARGGGNGITSVIVPHVSGIDVYKLLIKRIAGTDVCVDNLKNRAAILEFFDFRPGLVRRIEGVERAISEGFAARLELNFKEGDVIKMPVSDASRVGYFITLGNTRDDVDSKANRVKELVKIHYTE